MKTQFKTQWQTYKELELLPDSVSQQETNKSIMLPLRAAWRLLIHALANELVFEQQIEYLERCWTLGESEPYTAVKSKTWHKLWTLMN